MDYAVERLRKSVARDMAREYGFDYGTTLLWMQNVGVFENRTEWELKNRPVDIAELADCFEEAQRYV